MSAVTQEWTHQLTMMQQTVLLTAIRGPDGIQKYGSVKLLLRWFRRCTLRSAMDGRVLTTPYDNNGGSFTGPSIGVDDLAQSPPASAGVWAPWYPALDGVVDGYMQTVDALPHHFQMHLVHAAEIVGYKHPDLVIRNWWHRLYLRLVHSLHLHPETEAEMDSRLGDSREGWLKRADPATVA